MKESFRAEFKRCFWELYNNDEFLDRLAATRTSFEPEVIAERLLRVYDPQKRKEHLLRGEVEQYIKDMEFFSKQGSNYAHQRHNDLKMKLLEVDKL